MPPTPNVWPSDIVQSQNGPSAQAAFDSQNGPSVYSSCVKNGHFLQVIEVLSKLAGLWVNSNNEIMYSQASQITFICPMIFNYFPLDTQVIIYS